MILFCSAVQYCSMYISYIYMYMVYCCCPVALILGIGRILILIYSLQGRIVFMSVFIWYLYIQYHTINTRRIFGPFQSTPQRSVFPISYIERSRLLVCVLHYCCCCSELLASHHRWWASKVQCMQCASKSKKKKKKKNTNLLPLCPAVSCGLWGGFGVSISNWRALENLTVCLAYRM